MALRYLCQWITKARVSGNARGACEHRRMDQDPQLAPGAHEWIESREPLARFLAEGGPVLALDSEFMRVNTYWPVLALVQLQGAEKPALIDPLAFDAIAELGPMLASAQTVKVMHSASEDIAVLAHSGARRLAELFDTQIAAAYAGLGHGIGYRALVEREFGVTIPKDETRSDWRRRPLTAAQRAYAVADVAHLPALHGILSQRLATRGYLDWFREDCARLAAGAESYGALPRNPHWQLPAASRLAPARQAVLLRLLDERERLARQYDRPLRWIVDDAAALQLVRDPPPPRDEVLALLAQQRSFPKSERAAFADKVAEPAAAAEIEALEPAPLQADQPMRRRVDGLRDRAAIRAQELDLPPALLAPRRVLEALARDESSDELQGWRGV